MAEYLLEVGENTLARDRRRMTVGQWLVALSAREKGVPQGRTRIFDLREPVTVSVVTKDGDKPLTKVCRKSWQLLGMFSKGVIVALRWRSGGIGPHGLYALNSALRTAALRKGGVSIVRHWLETRREGTPFLRNDLFALLAYLEIRPVFGGKPAKIRALPTLSTLKKSVLPLYIMSIIYIDVFH